MDLGQYLASFSSTRSLVLLYLVEDVFSRKVTDAEVHEIESGEFAAILIQRTVVREYCYCQPLVLHADNDSTVKSQTLQKRLT